MSTLLVILTFSSGMPILYVIGFMFYSLTYIVNKVSLIKFYRREISLNRILPLESAKYFNTAIMIHIFFGCMMLTDTSLFRTKDAPTDELFIMPKLPFDPSQELKNTIKSANDTTSIMD